MAEGFELYHVPQQSRRDRLRVLSLPHPHLQGLVPIYDPSLFPSDFLTRTDNLDRQHQTTTGAASCTSAVKEEGPNFMGFVGAGNENFTAPPNFVYMDPRASVHVNPSSIQDANGDHFFYDPQNVRFLEQSFHGGEVLVCRPEALSLSLSSHQKQRNNLPLELNLVQNYDSSIYSSGEISGGGGGCVLFPGVSGADVLAANELSRSSPVPLGPFTGYASILKESRFLRPSQKLLEEVCDVGKGVCVEKMSADSVLFDPSVMNADDRQSCCLGDELGSKKSRLVLMLDEVFKRYKHYCHQMQAVVTSFESISGVKNAAPFATMAFKSVSKHFRSLKNAITNQLQFITDSHGHAAQGKNTAPGFDSPGTGIHGQRAIRSIDFVEHQQPVWRPQRGLPEHAVTILRAWLFDHFLHPYPTDTDKLMLAKQTGLSRNQVSNWFINARARLWKPMVEEIHMLETRGAQKSSQKEAENVADRETDHHSIPLSPSKTKTSSPSGQSPQDNSSLKRTRNAIDCNYGNLSRLPRSAGAGGAPVSLTLGLQQNNGPGLPNPFPLTGARRLGLVDPNGEGYALRGWH